MNLEHPFLSTCPSEKVTIFLDFIIKYKESSIIENERYLFLFSVIEIPFNLLVMFMVLKMGRRISAFCLLAVCGVALIGTMLIPT